MGHHFPSNSSSASASMSVSVAPSSPRRHKHRSHTAVTLTTTTSNRHIIRSADAGGASSQSGSICKLCLVAETTVWERNCCDQIWLLIPITDNFSLCKNCSRLWPFDNSLTNVFRSILKLKELWQLTKISNWTNVLQWFSLSLNDDIISGPGHRVKEESRRKRASTDRPDQDFVQAKRHQHEDGASGKVKSLRSYDQRISNILQYQWLLHCVIFRKNPSFFTQCLFNTGISNFCQNEVIFQNLNYDTQWKYDCRANTCLTHFWHKCFCAKGSSLLRVRDNLVSCSQDRLRRSRDQDNLNEMDNNEDVDDDVCRVSSSTSDDVEVDDMQQPTPATVKTETSIEPQPGTSRGSPQPGPSGKSPLVNLENLFLTFNK